MPKTGGRIMVRSDKSYARVGKAAEHQAGRYAHARQYRRMQREIRKLRTWLGRVIRDVQRKGGETAGALKHKIAIAQRLHAQRRDSKRLSTTNARARQLLPYTRRSGPTSSMLCRTQTASSYLGHREKFHPDSLPTPPRRPPL
jgi:hypothetical protein